MNFGYLLSPIAYRLLRRLTIGHLRQPLRRATRRANSPEGPGLRQPSGAFGGSKAPEGRRSPGRYRAVRRRALWILISLGLLLVAGWIALHFVPLPESLFAGPISQMEILDRTGKPLRVVRPGENPFARPLRYAEIPQPLIEATLAAEDRRFWKHHGVDPRATLRAMWQWARHRRVISGGSTITQQLIKLAQPRPRTLRTKIVEALQAMRLEQVWSKQQILSEYLNRLDYGNFNRGPAAAAQLYFAKPLHDLTPAECALLAALPQAPARLNPYSHFDRARKRQQWILRGMQNAGWLTDHELRRALDEPVQIARTRRVFEAPHFVDLLLATHRFTPKQPVRTTLDLELNHFSEMVLRRHLSGLRAQHVSNGALVILDNRSGDVLALVGSEDFFSPAAGQVNGAWAPRSPGSAFKPFTYLLALEHGDTPSTVVADVPTEFPTATGLFAPANYNRHCYGPMRYRLALANSLNISAVKVLASIGGPEPLQRLLQQCGLTTLNRSAEDYGLGLTLGNAEARLIELANAYACLARLGQFRPYRLVVAPDRDGSAMPARRIADASAAYLIADILSDNDARTPAFGSESALRFEFPVACKTGTSSDFRDNWAFGYTPEFTVGVWIGNPDNSPMQHVSGVTGAGPILHELFDHLHEQFGTTWYSQPANIVECRIHPITGKRLSESSAQRTSDAIAERFVAGNLPPLESSDDYESGSTRIVRLGSEYREWFGTGDNWLGDRAVPADAEKSLRVLFPPPGTTLYLDADLPAQGRRMVLRAAGSKAVDWRSDSLRIERNGIRDIAWLVEGKHEISVRDPVSGKEARTWVVVRAR